MPYIENFAEWQNRMKKGGHELLDVKDRILASDGGAWTSAGPIPPPEKYQDRLRAQRDFQSKKLERLESAFQRFEAALEMQLQYFELGSGPSPDEDDFARLSALRQRIADTRKAIEDIEDSITPTEQERYAESREKERVERLEYAERLRDRLRRLTI